MTSTREEALDIAIVGLGRMGGNMVRRLMLDGHRVVANNRSREPIDELAGEVRDDGSLNSEALAEYFPSTTFSSQAVRFEPGRSDCPAHYRGPGCLDAFQ